MDISMLEFHHIGVATNNLEREETYYRLLGYTEEGNIFEDPLQGIKGKFLVAPGHPRIELLQNLEGSDTLTPWLEQGVKMYHTAYLTDDIHSQINELTSKRVKLMKEPLPAVAFDGRLIAFLMMPNRALIELIESPN